MKKRKRLSYALSVAALCGGSLLSVGSVFADGESPFCIENMNGADSCYDTLQAAFDNVPSDGTFTNIYLSGEGDVVYDGGGAFYERGKGSHPANNNYNVAFDLRGKTYIISGAPVGSTGYETQAFHVEKGGKFVLKNGTVKAATDSGVWFIFQNYADTTFENVTLDARDNPEVTYVASNNFGSLNVRGDSNILAADGNVAFDLWYGMSSVYNDGITVNFGDDFAGSVKGKVEYGHASRIDEDSDWRSRAELNIENGDFDIEFRDGSVNALNGANINISGGTFSEVPVVNYIVDGYDAYSLSDEGPWKVDVATDEKDQTINVELGKTATIELSDIAKKYATLSSVDDDIATVDNNGVVTAKAAGQATITVQLHNLEDKGYSINVVVYEVGNNDAKVHTETVSIEKREENLIEELGEEAVELIKKVVGDANVAGYFDIMVNIVDENDNVLGKLDELGDMVLVTVDIPSGLDEVTEGYVRKYYMIRYHDGEMTKIEAVDNGDGTISFENDRFSTFVLVYEDVEQEEEAVSETITPDTGTMTAAGASASVAAMAAAVTVGVLTSIVSFAYLVRRKS
jgi:hypothetical protein